MRIEELMHWRLIKTLRENWQKYTMDGDDVLNGEPNADLVGCQLK